MKSTKVQTLSAPPCVRSLAHNNYLLLGMVMQHVESRSIREVQEDRLKWESSLLPLTLTRVSSRAELTISLCEDITVYGGATVNVNTQ